MKMEIGQALRNIDESDKEIIDFMAGMIGIPAISPESGGDGESKRADFIQQFLDGFDSVRRFDYESPEHPGIKRSSIVAVKNGKKPNTIWILSHIDTVPPGNLDDWDTDPFTLVVKDGRLYGRGTEDDGGPVLSSILASKQFLSEEFNGHSLGLIFVADEEIGSNNGLVKLLDEGLFKKGDMFFVPDVSTPENDMIYLAEKTVFWVSGKVIGKAAHGSTPEKGLNPLPVAMNIVWEIQNLATKYSQKDPIIENPVSTFTPTKFETSAGGTNAIPGYASFSLDCRLIPDIDPLLVKKDIEEILKKFETSSKMKIKPEFLIGAVGKKSSTDTPMYRALAESIEKITGKKVRPRGSNGATCAAHLRVEGYESYCWAMYSGTEHSPNEYTTLENIKTDAKVMAMVIHKLCV